MCERLVVTAGSEQRITRSYLDGDHPPVPNDLTPPARTGLGRHLHAAGTHIQETVVIEKNRAGPRCYGRNVRAGNAEQGRQVRCGLSLHVWAQLGDSVCVSSDLRIWHTHKR